MKNKKQQLAPPGIKSFVSDSGNLITVTHILDNYHEFCLELIEGKIAVHTISVDGTEWSVGEKVGIIGEGINYGDDVIKLFQWKCNRSDEYSWVVELKSGQRWGTSLFTKRSGSQSTTTIPDIIFPTEDFLREAANIYFKKKYPIMQEIVSRMDYYAGWEAAILAIKSIQPSTIEDI